MRGGRKKQSSPPFDVQTFPNWNIQSSYRGTELTSVCRDSERTITLPVYCRLIWKTARFRGRSHSGAISINSGYFVFPASRGISMVTLYAVKQKNRCSASLGPPVAHAAARVFPPLSWGSAQPLNDLSDQETLLLFRYRFNNRLPHAAACLMHRQDPRALQVYIGRTPFLSQAAEPQDQLGFWISCCFYII